MNGILLIALLVFVSCFSGCTASTGPQSGKALGSDGIACFGSVMEVPPGLDEMKNQALLDEAIGASGQGKLCTGKVFRVTHPLTVYRVWDGSNSNSVYGRWWSFSPPQGPRNAYREANEICAGWSALDRSAACILKVGTMIVVGPGQSADCAGTGYGKSPVNQIYVPNDGKAGRIYVEDCISSDSWPKRQVE